ncbi:hypothetical protein ABE288_04625 [Bacillus salipaludis]|uniref:hypothetical protein n=1 Tax=Bacillus salipaludis TaxID=2547811 RepID=UPI003D23AD23
MAEEKSEKLIKDFLHSAFISANEQGVNQNIKSELETEFKGRFNSSSFQTSRVYFKSKGKSTVYLFENN